MNKNCINVLKGNPNFIYYNNESTTIGPDKEILWA